MDDTVYHQSDETGPAQSEIPSLFLLGDDSVRVLRRRYFCAPTHGRGTVLERLFPFGVLAGCRPIFPSRKSSRIPRGRCGKRVQGIRRRDQYKHQDVAVWRVDRVARISSCYGASLSFPSLIRLLQASFKASLYLSFSNERSPLGRVPSKG